MIERVKAWWLALQNWLRGPIPPIPVPPPPAPLPPPQACVSVVIPALNEGKRIGGVVRHALADAATAEVIVVDDSSIDDTVEQARAAGAAVITSTMLGKGPSMRDGLAVAQQSLVVYLDGDLSGLRPGLIGELVRPLLADEADFVKARFGRSGGRVTELTAKPMLKVFFPELASLAQPLGGIVAARRSLLAAQRFEDGYGVDVGLMIDCQRAGARIVEVDIGSLEHDSQPLGDLTSMANEVSRVIYSRARAAGRLHVDQIVAMYEVQRQAAASIEAVLLRRRGRRRLLLLDMDGTVTPLRYVQAMARATGAQDVIEALLDGTDDVATRSERIAAAMRFVHQDKFELVARELPIRPGTIEFVNRMRRAGFMVGLVSDSWFVGAEIVRRRVFADFALAHTLRFEHEVCTGELHLNPAFRPLVPGRGAALCKSHVIERFLEACGSAGAEQIWAVGDNLNDLEMLRAADRAFVIEPKAAHLARDADAQRITSFEELLPLVPRAPEEVAAA